MPSFSLVGALEFRSVISSLQQDAAGTSLGTFEPPMLTPFPGGHYHSFVHSRSRSHGSIRSGSPRISDASSDVPLSDRSPLPPASSLPADDRWHSILEEPLISTDGDAGPQIPQISHTPASPRSDTNSDFAHHTAPAPRRGIRHILSLTSHILFPTLHEFRAKSLLGKVAAVFAAPAVFVLTVTLPVVVKPYDDVGYRHEKTPSIHHTLFPFEENGIERTLIAEEEEMDGLQFNKWLMAAQCAFGPVFCASVLFSTFVAFMRRDLIFKSYPEDSAYGQWIRLGIGLAGVVAGVSVAIFADKGSHPWWLPARCSMGFLVAVVWIMAIADEVVSILQVSEAECQYQDETNLGRPSASFLDCRMLSLV